MFFFSVHDVAATRGQYLALSKTMILFAFFSFFSRYILAAFYN